MMIVIYTCERAASCQPVKGGGRPDGLSFGGRSRARATSEPTLATSFRNTIVGVGLVKVLCIRRLLSP
jgi:hypothetical protein